MRDDRFECVARFAQRDHGRDDRIAEVLRVLQNYQAVQHRGLSENPQLYSLSELLYSIDDINVVLSYDTVLVTIKIRNAESTQASLVIAQSLL